MPEGHHVKVVSGLAIIQVCDEDKEEDPLNVLPDFEENLGLCQKINISDVLAPPFKAPRS